MVSYMHRKYKKVKNGIIWVMIDCREDSEMVCFGTRKSERWPFFRTSEGIVCNVLQIV